MDINCKFDNLKRRIKKMDKAVVAFSGGVDSTFLLKVVHDILGDGTLAVTARSSTYPERELKLAVKFASRIGVEHLIIVSEELDIEGFCENPTNRCYYCKKELYCKIRSIAEKRGIKYILDGSNLDDTGDYRPGLEAVRELEVISPLKEERLTKNEIRVLSREMNLDTWDKPPFACLSSRFPYGQQITVKKLQMVDSAEQYLLDRGFKQVRVRHHGDIARIEVNAHERCKFFDENTMDEVNKKFKLIGFKYTALDLKGYRTGSMNEAIFKT